MAHAIPKSPLWRSASGLDRAMNSPFRHGSEPAEISEVNVVPLCDVSLVLLIILMVISPMMAQSMLMLRTAAQAKQPPPPEKNEPIPPQPQKPDLVLVVGLGTSNITVGDQSFGSLAGFMGYMSKALASRADKKVFLSPSHDVTNGKVVNMLELLKQLGAQSVALVQHEDPDADADSAGPPAAAAPSAPAPDASGAAVRSVPRARKR